jgi:hypothetical protein
MADVEITPRGTLNSWTFATGKRYQVLIHRFKVDLIEMEDAHFHLDSAVMLPERDPKDASDARSGDEITGLSVLRATYLHAKANAGKKLLCAGHTDRSGSESYNLKLSALRAKNVRALLTGDEDGWASISADKHVPRDVQVILKWIANVRYWPDCDPGPIDGDIGDKTHKAVKAFKKRFNDAYGGSLADNASIDKPTWKAFFHMYLVGLAGIMQTDDAGLASARGALTWLSPDLVGCGEAHPITPETAGNYRSQIDRRVELLFFNAGEEPQLGKCHPSDDSCVAKECEVYSKRFLRGRFYEVTPVVVTTNAKVSLRLEEVRGLYKPGFSDPADVSAGTAKLAGYEKGYKSDDGKGRIYLNQIPRVDTSVAWDDVKKKDKQYIELSAVIDVAEGALPPDAQVVWEWSDPDDPSDANMRDDAAEDVDPNDFNAGARTGEVGDDNAGTCDFPSPKAGPHPAFEQIGPYTLTPAAADDKHCFTLISGGKSEVRFHCTDAGGDNFQVKATVRPSASVVVTAGDATGIMTMWKRIDVEYRKMPDAEEIPAKDIVPFFEPQFIQMDVGDPQPTTSNKPFTREIGLADPDTTFVAAEFVHNKKPGWFFVCAAREASPPAGHPRFNLYEGPAKLVEDLPHPAPPPAPGHIFDTNNLTRWESIVIDGVLAEAPLAVAFREGTEVVIFFASGWQPNLPVPGKSTIQIEPIDFQSDFEPGDGSLNNAYGRRAFYSPRFRFRWPEQAWESGGYRFPSDVYVAVISKGRSVTGGTSPGVFDAAHKEYFAGRTIMFTRNPGFTKPASVKMTAQGSWNAGDLVKVDIAGTSATYTVTASDVTVPPGVPDASLFVNGQVGRGIERLINGNAPWTTVVNAETRFGEVKVKAAQQGTSGNGIPVAVTVTSPSGSSGSVALAAPTLAGGGFDAESRQDILQTITHEFGHAFGFPHKCGYFTFENAPLKSCTMNYFHTWPYKLGTQRDPAAREVERFWKDQGEHFCARHTRGMRRVRLEENPVMWTW